MYFILFSMINTRLNNFGAMNEYHGEYLINTLVAMRLIFTANPLHAYWLLNTLAGKETNWDLLYTL